MIRYALRCDQGHEFEGWFGSSMDYDAQRQRGLVECPSCRSAKIEKALMAPAVATSRKREERAEAPRDLPAAFATAGLNAEQREMLRQMRDLRARLLASAEDVGERFPEEARKIHYGEATARGIYGKASLEDAVELAEEGIGFLPLPEIPEDGN